MIFFVVGSIWSFVLMVDLLRGKFLHKGTESRLKIFGYHISITIVFLFIGILIVDIERFDYLDHRFASATLNVREGPSINADTANIPLREGQEIYVLSDTLGWVAISTSPFDSVLYGWVSKKFTESINEKDDWEQKKAQEEEEERKRELAIAREKKAQEEKIEKQKEQRRKAAKKREDKIESLKKRAFLISQKAVKKYLKSPSTADFPFLDYEATVLSDNKVIIQSYVDSQNSFGAILRTKYRASLIEREKGWSLSRLYLNGELVHSED